MPNLITTHYINQVQFYQMPKAFFHNSQYTAMKNESKLAYMIIRDLLPLSIENKWVNENNEIYVKISRDKLMTRLNIKGTQKFAQVMKELCDYELIVYKKVGATKCNEIYVCIPDDLATLYSDQELLECAQENNTETIENTIRFENQTSRSLKIKPQEVRKSNLKKFENQTSLKSHLSLDHQDLGGCNLEPIKTNIIKTNIIKTKSVSQSNPKVSQQTDRRTDFAVMDQQALSLIKEHIALDELQEIHPQDKDLIQEIETNIDLMYYSETLIVNKQSKPQALVRSMLNKLTLLHVEDVLLRFKDHSQNHKIKNTQAYLQVLLFNAPSEMKSSIRNSVLYHM